MSAVNIDVAMPSDSTTAKPRIGPVPKAQSTTPAISPRSIVARVGMKLSVE